MAHLHVCDSIYRLRTVFYQTVRTNFPLAKEDLSYPSMPNVFPFLITWTSLFQVIGWLLGGIFHFNSNLNRNFCLANSGEPDQMPSFVESDLV